MYLVPASAVCSTRVLFVIGSQHVFKNVVVRFQICRQWVSHVFSRVFEWILLIWPLQRALLGSVFVVSILLRCVFHVYSLCVRSSSCYFWIQSSVVALLLIVLVAQGFADNFFSSPDFVVVFFFFLFFSVSFLSVWSCVLLCALLRFLWVCCVCVCGLTTSCCLWFVLVCALCLQCCSWGWFHCSYCVFVCLCVCLCVRSRVCLLSWFCVCAFVCCWFLYIDFRFVFALCCRVRLLFVFVVALFGSALPLMAPGHFSQEWRLWFLMDVRSPLLSPATAQEMLQLEVAQNLGHFLSRAQANNAPDLWVFRWKAPKLRAFKQRLWASGKGCEESRF